MNSDEAAVADVMVKYQDALNRSDTDAVMKLYAFDGVFMPQNSASSVGADAFRKAYDGVFDSMTVSVEFDVAEVRQVAPEWSLVRTNSAGTVKVEASGEGGPEANGELFVFQKVDGSWKIARYCFSTTSPSRS